MTQTKQSFIRPSGNFEAVRDRCIPRYFHADYYLWLLLSIAIKGFLLF